VTGDIIDELATFERGFDGRCDVTR